MGRPISTNDVFGPGEAEPVCGLVEFSYRSRPVEALGMEELRAIAAASWRNNTRAGVSGYLSYDGTAFHQELVGDPRAVAFLAAVILADKRHHQIEVLRYHPASHPRTEGWRLVGFDAVMCTRADRMSWARGTPNVIRGPFDTGR